MQTTAQPARTLHQFPISHYCEKTRWHLDIKGLSYKTRNLLPGVHAVINRRLVGRSSVPVLIDREHALRDSTAIALYLDESYPGHELVPQDVVLRARILELTTYFDRNVGGAVRRWLYGQLLKVPGATSREFFRGYGTVARAVGRVTRGLFERKLRAMYSSEDAALAESERTLLAAIAHIERITSSDPTRFLVGETLTLADVTAVSLLGPLLAPPGSPWADSESPAPVTQLREQITSRPGGQWVLRCYAQHRR